MTEQSERRPNRITSNSIVWRKSSFSETGECVELGAASWTRSSFSGPSNCVEVAAGSSWTGMRDSKNPDGPPLLFPRDTMVAFLHGVKAGEFDLQSLPLS